MWLYYALAALLLLQSLLSLRGGFRYLRFFRRELRHAPADFTPRASVIVPCRGVDQDLRANLDLLFQQHYPSYELIFVADDANDPALEIVEAARREHAQARECAGATANAATIADVRTRASITSRVVIAGRARDCGQKVHNLRVAVEACDAACDAFVFVDTDARVRRDWLRSLIAPLADERLGAATGYRWFVPAPRARFSSHLRAVWNASIASALGADTRRNFCWGGSTAMRRSTFNRLDMSDEWRGTLSDDFTLTRVLERAHLPIKFVPACLVVSHDECSWRTFFEFTTRQLKITRVYAPRLWQIVLVSNFVFCAVFYSGILIIAARALRGASFALPLALVASIFALGACKAHLRLRAVNPVLAREHAQVRGVARLAHLSVWTLTSAIFLYNALAAGFSRRITWRGISYELKSPTETLIIESDAVARP